MIKSLSISQSCRVAMVGEIHKRLLYKRYKCTLLFVNTKLMINFVKK